MLTNQNIDSQNKRLTCKFLDILYIEGLQLPSKLHDQVISGFNTLNSQDEMQQEGKFGALSLISVNKKNYDAIVQEGYFDDAIDSLSEKTIKKEVESVVINSLLIFLRNIYINSSEYTQQIMKQEIRANTLKKLVVQNDYKNETQILESSLIYPETMNKLMRIRRSVINKGNQYIIELIVAGLMDELFKEFDQLMKKKVYKYNNLKDRVFIYNKENEQEQIKSGHQIGQEEEIIRSSNENMEKADVYSTKSYEYEMYQLKRQNEEGESDKESVMGRKSLNEVMHIQYFGRPSADEQENESDQEKEIDLERDCGVNDIFNDNEDNKDKDDKDEEKEQEQENYEDDIEITEIEGFGEEGLMLIVMEIIKSLIYNNQEGNNMIVFETEFIDNILKLLNNN
ncbi:MAG: hypothetical protein EZS28_038952, partial [Streblomastix strix]